MERNFRKAPAAGAGASPPSEPWLFAQAVLGKPVPSPFRAEADARARREHLEWLAQISPEDARRVRGQLSEEADAKAQRKHLEWLAEISPEHEVKFRALQRAEAEALETREHWEWLAQVSTVHEGNWDPSQHPRASKGQPDGGQWVAKGGSGGASGSPSKQGEPGGAPAAPAESPTTKPQLPADHRGTWVSGTKGDGVFRYNDSVENQQAGVAGKEVRFENQHIAVGGFPPEAYYGGSQGQATVDIKTVTGLDADNLVADALMRAKLGDPTWQRPKEYVWNHAGPPGSKAMELVDARYHVAISHKGPAAEPRALLRTAGVRGATARVMGALTVYVTARDALQAAGILQPSYEVAERETYHYVAEDGSDFVVWPAGLFSSAKREFVAGPRKGQTETITSAQVEAYRKQAEKEWGKYIPETLFSDARFIPGTKRKSLPLIGYKYGIPYDAGWIDEKGSHHFQVPGELST